MVANQISGTLINISSNHASGCWPRASVYGPAKAAVEKMTKNIALELAPHGIRVIGIAPGYTHARNTPPDKMKTDNDPQNDPQIGPLNDPQIGPLIKPLNDPQIGPLIKRIPLQRFAQPEEIGNMVVFLASSLAGYITGTTIYMDGGALLPVLVENTYV
jgi:NAD(P)-dependent dehydrogenase (short-subunit alcohol dehydrogenase family)